MGSDNVDRLFAFHKLNAAGQRKAQTIAQLFDILLQDLIVEGGTDGREGAIVKTKLEEACFFAKKAMAVQPENQEPA